MTPQQQVEQITNKLVANLSRITEYPENWLPHTVWVEEVNPDTGDPVYCHYMLEKIRSDGTCDLHNPETGKLEHAGYYLTQINTDWLITLWGKYIELCTAQKIPTVNTVFQTKSNPEPSGLCPQPHKTKKLPLNRNLYAFIWHCNHMPRDISDDQLIEAWETGSVQSTSDKEDDTEYEVEKLTPDELAERINDDDCPFGQYYLRFIEIEE